MDHFHNRAQAVAGRTFKTTQTRAQQKHGRPQPLSAAFVDVPADPFDKMNIGTRLPKKFLFDLLQILFYQPEKILWIQFSLFPTAVREFVKWFCIAP
jgi:hypothetical protein